MIKKNKKLSQAFAFKTLMLALLVVLFVALINSNLFIEIKSLENTEAIVLETKEAKSLLSFIGHPNKYITTLKSDDIISDISSITIAESKISGDTMPVRKVLYRNKITNKESYSLLPVLDESGFVILN